VAATTRAAQLSPTQKVDDLRRLADLEQAVKQLELNATKFYDYSIVCGGLDYDSRVYLPNIDPGIPAQYHPMIHNSFVSPADRNNKCPRWSAGEEKNSGAMEKLLIDENTPIGTKVYTLLAVDPELQPVYYFIRNVESEPVDAPIILKITQSRVGNNFIGEVTVNAKLDYEAKRSYQYLTYAFDGFNLLERYTSIEILDLDDEPPHILSNGNSDFNVTADRFEYNVYENISIGSIVNDRANISLFDIDTQKSQLKVRLLNLDSEVTTGGGLLPFAINNDGQIKLVKSLDYEVKRDYLFKLIIEVSFISNKFFFK
jgi:hypothetical protein